MATVPVNSPFTTPPLTVATEGLLLLHAPPAVAHERFVDAPRQTPADPVMAAGVRFTVNNLMA
jgi:hypothetical protein